MIFVATSSVMGSSAVEGDAHRFDMLWVNAEAGEWATFSRLDLRDLFGIGQII
jgi:hypothetical protein